MEFEQQMPFPPVPGAMEFIHLLKSKDVKVGLVTSSDDAKLKRAFRLLKLDNLFDTVVSADRITKGKPDPMCYCLPPPTCMYHLPTVWYLKTLLPEYRPGPMRVCGLSDLARPIPKSL